MRCCIASSTTSRLKDQHNQVSLASQSKRRQWGGFRAAFFCFMAMPLTVAAGKANNPRRRLPLVLEVSLSKVCGLYARQKPASICAGKLAWSMGDILEPSISETIKLR